MKYTGHLLTSANPTIGQASGGDDYYSVCLAFGDTLVIGGWCDVSEVNSALDAGVMLAAYDLSSGTPVQTDQQFMSMRAIQGDYPTSYMMMGRALDASRGLLVWNDSPNWQFLAFSVVGGKLTLATPVNLTQTGETYGVNNTQYGAVLVTNTADYAALPNWDGTHPYVLQVNTTGLHTAFMASYGDGRVAFCVPGLYHTGGYTAAYIMCGTQFTVTGLTITPGNWYVLSYDIPVGPSYQQVFSVPEFDYGINSVARNNKFCGLTQTRTPLLYGNNYFTVYFEIDFDAMAAGGVGPSVNATNCNYDIILASGSGTNDYSGALSADYYSTTAMFLPDGRFMSLFGFAHAQNLPGFNYTTSDSARAYAYVVHDSTSACLIAGAMPFYPDTENAGFTYMNDPSMLAALGGVIAATSDVPTYGYVLDVPTTGLRVSSYTDEVGTGTLTAVTTLSTTDTTLNKTPTIPNTYWDSLQAVLVGTNVVYITDFGTNNSPYQYYQDIQVFALQTLKRVPVLRTLAVDQGVHFVRPDVPGPIAVS